MGNPNNSECHCYSIMTSLCLPCQVKVHLLHMTPSPHGELLRGTRSSSAKDGLTGSPCREQPPARASASRKSNVNSGCEMCDYYVNFISQLTSGLHEETIMKIIHGNHSFISSDHPNPTEHRNDQGQHRQPPNSNCKEVNTSGNNRASTHDLRKFQVRIKNSRESFTVPCRFSPEVTEYAATDHPDEERTYTPSYEKPTTPENIITTDKILKQRFDSKARKRLKSAVSTRGSSPEKKRPETKQGTEKRVKRSDHKSTKSNKPTNNVTTFQKSSPHSESIKAPKNPPKLKKIESADSSKRLSRSSGKESNVSRKKNSANVGGDEAVPLSYTISFSTISKSEPCSMVEYELNPGHHSPRGSKGGTKKIEKAEEGKGPGSTEMSKMKVDANTGGGFYEAAFVVEFHEPPKQEDCGMGSDATKHPRNEHSNTGSMREIMKQKPHKKIQAKDENLHEANDTAENSQQREVFAKKRTSDQATTKEQSSRLSSTRLNQEDGGMGSDAMMHPRNEHSNAGSRREIIKQKPHKNIQAKDKNLHDVNDAAENSQQREAFAKKRTSNQATTKELSSRWSTTSSKRPSRFEDDFSSDINEASLAMKPSKPQCICQLTHTSQRHPKEGSVEAKRKSEPSDLRKQDVQRGDGQSEAPITSEGTNAAVLDKLIVCSKRTHNNSARLGGRDERNLAPQFLGETIFDQARQREDFGRHGINKMGEEEGRSAGTAEVSKAERRSKSSRDLNCNDGDSRSSPPQHKMVDRRVSEYNNYGEVDVKHTLQRRGRLSEDDDGERPIREGIIKKIREEIAHEFRQTQSTPSSLRQINKSPVLMGDDEPECTDDRVSGSRSPSRRKLKSPERQRSPSGTSLAATSVYTAFSEYRNLNCEGYKSKSTGNIIEPADRYILPVKSSSGKDSLKWKAVTCPDGQKLYNTSESDQKSAKVSIRSDPQETASPKMENSLQKSNRRDSGTQCDYHPPESNSSSPPPTAKVKLGKGRVPPKTTAKHLQASDPIASRRIPIPHQQMFYNRPLVRRSFQ